MGRDIKDEYRNEEEIKENIKIIINDNKFHLLIFINLKKKENIK